jgi:hypothetical protein
MILQAAASFATAVGLGFAIHTWRRGQRIRRAEWLSKLYEKFYENPEFRKTRRLLDYEGAHRQQLLADLKAEKDSKPVEDWSTT